MSQAAGAPGDDTIEIDASQTGLTIQLTSTSLSVDSSVTIEVINATPGESVTIDGSNLSTPGSVFVLQSGVQVTMSDLTITGGTAASGGGVYVSGSASLDLQGVVVSSNAAQSASGSGQGGGLYLGSGASLSATQTTFLKNQALGASAAAGLGGAIFATSANISLSGVQFTSNSAKGGAGGSAQGGGLYWNGTGSFVLTQTTFTKNQAVAGDGAAGVAATNNGAGGGGGSALGGGLYLGGGSGTYTLSGNSFTSNQAIGGAGGGGADSNTNPQHGLGGNGGTGAGGGLYWAGGTATLTNFTFNNNSAQGGQGGQGGTGRTGNHPSTGSGGKGSPAGAGGDGGVGQGGAAYWATGSATFSGGMMASNRATGGAGGTGGRGGAGGLGALFGEGGAGATAGPGGAGGAGQGGGLYWGSGSGQLTSSIPFSQNRATGGAGGAGGAGGTGGQGGGTNPAKSGLGIGGQGGTGSTGGTGGAGQGGGLYWAVGTATQLSGAMAQNMAVGGTGGAGGSGGEGGVPAANEGGHGGNAGVGGDAAVGQGGALFWANGTATLINASMSSNQAIGGNGGVGGTGGNGYAGSSTILGGNRGGNAGDGNEGGDGNLGQGGAVYWAAGNGTLANATISANQAIGGRGGSGGAGGVGGNGGSGFPTKFGSDGGTGGNGGNAGNGAAGQGGGIFWAGGSATLTILNLSSNQAVGGTGGAGGSGGTGGNGGDGGNGQTGDLGQPGPGDGGHGGNGANGANGAMGQGGGVYWSGGTGTWSDVALSANGVTGGAAGAKGTRGGGGAPGRGKKDSGKAGDPGNSGAAGAAAGIQGGGLFLFSGVSLSIQSGSFQKQQLAQPIGANAQGGAIYASGVAALTLQSVGFTSNSVRANVSGYNAQGGGLYWKGGGALKIGGTTFLKNQATGLGGGAFGQGGAIFATSASNVAISNGHFTSNSARGSGNLGNAQGGGLYWSGNGGFRLTQSTFNKNRAAGANGASGPSFQAGGDAGNGQGGGLYLSLGSGGATLTGNTFQGNVAQGGVGGRGGTGGDGGAAGYAQGGGLYLSASGGSATLTGNSFSSNSALGGNGGAGGAIRPGGDAGSAQGGALYLNVANATLTGNTLQSNSAVGGQGGEGGPTVFTEVGGNGGNGGNAQGGGLYWEAGTGAFTGNIWATNKALGGRGGGGGGNRGTTSNTGLGGTGGIGGGAQGGGLFWSGGQATILNEAIVGNQAVGGAGGQGGSGVGVVPGSGNNGGTAQGGGLYWNGSGSLTWTNSTLGMNQANGGNGGNQGAGQDNRASGGSGGNGQGGGFYLAANIAVTLTNLTVAGNQANFGSGGAGNSSGHPGSASDGGLSLTSGTTTLVNSIVANNSVPSGPADIGGTIAQANYSLIGSSTSGGNYSITSGSNNLIGVNPTLGTLQDNGSGSPTFALLPGSPAIDAGNNAAVTNPPYSGPPFDDQRGPGYNRIVNGGSSLTVDIGAYEYQPPDTTTVITSSPNPSGGGQSVTLTATVTAVAQGSDPVQGTVTFTVQVGSTTTTLGTANLDANGVATLDTTALPLGTSTVTATYGGFTQGDFSFTGSFASLTQVVGTVTSTALVASPSPSVYTQTVTFTATVTSQSGTPGGSVTFFNGSTQLGTVNLDGSGVATFSTSALAAGTTYQVTAQYNGNGQYVPSTSNVVAQQVNGIPTTTTVVVSANPAVFGQEVTFTVTVAPNAPYGGIPTGTVVDVEHNKFYPLVNGVATITVTAGETSAEYEFVYTPANPNYALSSWGPFELPVDPATTTTTLTASATSAQPGQTITFTATVSVNSPGSAAGPGLTELVTFYDGATVLGTAAVDSNGVATFTTSQFSLGSNAITAVYPNQLGQFVGSTSNAVAVGVEANTTTALSSPNATITYGQPLTLVATVTATGANPPTGTVTFVGPNGVLGTAALDSNGVATLNLTGLQVSPGFNVTASFSGEGAYLPSQSNPLAVVVYAQSSSTTFVASTNNPVYGQSVTFTATVSPTIAGSPTPTGSVTFAGDGFSVSVPVQADGTASYTTTALPLGTTSLNVTFLSSSANYLNSGAGANITVAQAGTTIALTSSANPASAGESFAVTVAVSPAPPGGGTPTGQVTITVDGSVYANPTLTNGSATINLSFDSPGSHTIAATYSGDTNYQASGPSSYTQVITASATTTTLTASAGTTVFGQPLTFTAVVEGVISDVPTGLVVFRNGSTILGSGQLISSGPGTATFEFTTSGLAPGSYGITADYSGDSDFAPSTSTPPLPITVAQGATTTAVASSPNPSTYGQPVTFMATVAVVAPAAGTPTGTVAFFANGTFLGSGTLGTDGVAQFTTTVPLAAGAYAITATYQGDLNFSSSNSTNSLTQTVAQGATSTAITTSTSPSVFGQSVTFTATVSPNLLAAGTPTGTLQFFGVFGSNTTLLGSATLVGGTASLSTTSLAVGGHSIYAVYQGNSDFSSSTSSSIAQQVNAAGTTTTINATPNPVRFGQAISFTATVAANAPGGGTPTGSVSFFDTVGSTGTLLDTVPLVNGVATFQTASLATGRHRITAVYSGGSPDFNDSTSRALVVAVDRDATTTAVVSSASPSAYGQAVTFTATVNVTAPAAGSLSGIVDFFDDQIFLGSGTLSGSQATLTTSTLAPGAHTIRAIYRGDSDFAGSVAATAQQVGQDSTTTVAATGSSPSLFGQSVTFTATVSAGSPGSGVPTGTVTFFDGSTAISSPIALVNGAANFTTSTLAVGTHAITAQYSGSADFTASLGSVSQQVNVAATQTSLTSSPDPSKFGQTVTLTAQVSAVAPGGGTPTGTVTFYETVGSNTVTLGTQNLVAGVATLTISSLSVGNHVITAQYQGVGSYTGSQSASVVQAVTRGDTTTQVASSSNPSVSGQRVTFTATLGITSPAAGTPTGTVAFFFGSTLLGTAPLSGLQASWTTTSLPIGGGAITAVYSGDGQFSGSRGSLTQQVAQASTAVAVTSSGPVVYGQPFTLTAIVAVTPPGGGVPTGSVAFTASDGTNSYDLGTVTVGNGGQAVLTATTTLPPGSYTVTAQYSGDASFLSSQGTVAQQVSQDAASTLLVSQQNPSLFGTPITFTATVTASAPGAGTPTGTVSFTATDGINSYALGSATISGGIAAVTTNVLTAGTYTITAQYSGDVNFAAGTSNAVTQAVQALGTVATVTSGTDPSVFGESVTFTATVSDDSGLTPTGTVEFFSTVGGTKTSLGAPITLDASGQATLATAALAVGENRITVEYVSNSSNFDNANSAPTLQVVLRGSTATSLSSSVEPSVFGQAVTFTATVTPAGPASGTITGQVAFYDGGVLLGRSPVSGTQATFTTTPLSVGTHSIRAVYEGDGNFRDSLSAALDQQVNQGATTTTLATSPPSTVAGQPVILTATVGVTAPAAGTPTGEVAFYNGTTLIGTAQVSGGQATLSTSSLGVGALTLSAVYSGDGQFATSEGSLTFQVGQASTSVSVTGPGPIVYGQPLSLSAIVTPNPPGAGDPTGTVVFTANDGTNNFALGTGTVGAGGQVALTSAVSLPPGTYTITAVYSGDSNFNQGQGTITQQVAQDASTTVVTTSPNPSVFSQSVTMTATIIANAPGGGGSLPSGTVVFYSGATAISGPMTVVNGTASFSLSTLPVGTASITAVYSGDANFTTSTSIARPQVVNKASTTTSIGASDPSTVFGESVTFTATVNVAAPASGTAIGAVAFFDGDTYLGTADLTGATAILTTDALGVGRHTITVVYAGNGDYHSSRGSIELTVGQDTTTTVTVTDISPSSFGQSVTFTATVSANLPGAGTPGGSVAFFDLFGSVATSLGTVPLVGGSAAFATSSLAVGSHSIYAVYQGSSDFLTSTSDPVAQQVDAASTSTTLSAAPNPGRFGQSLIFTAAVATNAPGRGTPSGSVSFFEAVGGTLTLLGTRPLVAGIATFQTAHLAVGQHSIKAVYSGDNPSFDGSTSPTLVVAVDRGATSSTVVSSASTSVFGQAVSFTATVTVDAPAAGTPSGVVAFFDGATYLGEARLSGGAATFTTSALSLGVHGITAIYEGDVNFEGDSSPEITQLVTADSTTTAITSSANPSVFDQPITLTATVSANSPGSGTPTGIVTFYETIGTVTTALGTRPVFGGFATLRLDSLSRGDHVITAVYSGDPRFDGGTSAPFVQSVARDSTLTTLTSSAPSATYGQPVTFVATVRASAPGGGVPTGLVVFSLDGVPLAAVPLVNGMASFEASSISAGRHNIQADYAGDLRYAPNYGTTALLVAPAATLTTLTTSPNPVLLGQAVVLTAVVRSPDTGLPVSGTVTFFNGSTILGTAPLDATGVASLTVDTGSIRANSLVASRALLDVGTIVLTAVYNGDADFLASTSAAVAQTVLAPPVDTAPTVTRVLRYGYHAQPTVLRLTFSELLDPESATNPANYRIVAFDGSRHGAGRVGHRVRLRRVEYDPATLTVTLIPVQRLNIHRIYRLEVIGTPPGGLRSWDGRYLDGNGNGQPGSNFVTQITRRNLAGPSIHSPGPGPGPKASLRPNHHRAP